jgi:hypothetical protein
MKFLKKILHLLFSYPIIIPTSREFEKIFSSEFLLAFSTETSSDILFTALTFRKIPIPKNKMIIDQLSSFRSTKYELENHVIRKQRIRKLPSVNLTSIVPV